VRSFESTLLLGHKRWHSRRIECELLLSILTDRPTLHRGVDFETGTRFPSCARSLDPATVDFDVLAMGLGFMFTVSLKQRAETERKRFQPCYIGFNLSKSFSIAVALRS